MSISDLTGKRLQRVKESTVFDHLLESSCSIDFDHFNILAPDASKFRLLVRKKCFAFPFSVYNTVGLSRHEQVCLIRLHFRRYFSY